jgi:aldehyde dehydrogenase (NAD+)
VTVAHPTVLDVSGKNFIGGEWLDATSGEQFEQRDPADLRRVNGRWPRSAPKDAIRAVDAASGALSDWSALTVYERARILRLALAHLRERASQLEAVIVAENGKTSAEANAEIAAAIREMEHQIDEGVRQSGEEIPSSLAGVTVLSRRVPVGVALMISPWNFPLNVPGRKVVPALVTGNTCILKPSSLTPGAADQFVRCFEEAGLPAGVLNLVHGSGSDLGDTLLDDPRIAAVSFTGSTPVGLSIHARASAKLIRTQMEMGGKNPLVVLADADVEAAAAAAITAGYACAGQWCTATSRVVVEESIANSFIDALLAKVDAIVVGPGAAPGVTMGPVCGSRRLEDVLEWIDLGKAEGARIVRGGHHITDGELQWGCFVRPTVFTDAAPGMKIAQEEIFGPVVTILRADSFEHSVDIANGVRFGLSSSVFTRDLEKAMAFVERTEVGLTHVNLHTAYKEPQAVFGGTKLSGVGLPEAGRSGVEFFTKHLVAYVKHR